MTQDELYRAALVIWAMANVFGYCPNVSVIEPDDDPPGLPGQGVLL